MAETILLGDAAEQLRTLDADSVHCCVTSPPYFGLRDYGVSGQIGQEATPEEYVSRLAEVFREVRRVLRPDGTLWLNIGDSYRNKNLIGIPWMLAFALRADGWYLRQDIIWYKPNAMPESVKDRCTKSHEHVFLLAKSARYYFDAVAIREPVMGDSTKRYLRMCGGQADTAALPRFGGSKYGDSTSEETRYKSGKEYKPPHIGTNAMSGSLAPAATRAHTSPCSRKSWWNPASWPGAPRAGPCWIPSRAAAPPA